MLDNAFYFNYINVKFKAKIDKIFLLTCRNKVDIGSAINKILFRINLN